MINNFHLVAFIKERGESSICRIPLVQGLQDELARQWDGQLQEFLQDAQEVDFEPGYIPEAHERFRLSDFALPGQLAGQDSGSVRNLDPIDMEDAGVDGLKAIIGFARQDDGREIVLVQNFTRSHIIAPGRFLFFTGNNFETSERPALSLDSHLAAVYYPDEQKLLFRNFRVANAILSLEQYYEEASEEDIHTILAHEKLAPVNADALARNASQWFGKRFAMLRDSGILDAYTVDQIVVRSGDYGLDVQIDRANGHDRIIFPAEKTPAKKLLQFLNEELFRGAITETLYETNSKREAD